MKLSLMLASLAIVFSNFGFAETACLDRSNDSARSLNVALGEVHTKVIEIESQGVMANVVIPDYAADLKNAVESGDLKITAAVFPRGVGSALLITMDADFEAQSMMSKIQIEVYGNYHDVVQVVELPLEVVPVLVLPFGYDENQGKVVWQTPEDIQLPVHTKALKVCFEMLTVPPRDYRVHVQGAREVLPHQPSDWLLTEPGVDVGTYTHLVTTKDQVTIEYREHSLFLRRCSTAGRSL
jgi:hypothetical protein